MYPKLKVNCGESFSINKNRKFDIIAILPINYLGGQVPTNWVAVPLRGRELPPIKERKKNNRQTCQTDLIQIILINQALHRPLEGGAPAFNFACKNGLL